MMRLREVAQALKAHCSGEDVLFTGVSTDSRTLRKGDLFVALSGNRHDGSRYVRAAQDQGATAAMVGMASDIQTQSADISFIRVDDTRLALGQLAAYWRARFSMPVVAVTGSNGKTTVKDMLTDILRQAVNHDGEYASVKKSSTDANVLATEGNFNNDIGMPLMLLRMRDSHQYAVIEMGMNHVGEIAYLTQLAKPGVAVITNAGCAHIQGLGTIEAVARAKGEIFAGLDARGIAVINSDDAYAPLWREMAGKRQIIDFGLHKDALVSLEYRSELNSDGYGSKITIRLPDEMINVNLQVPGIHNIRNALTAAATAVALGIDGKTTASGLARFKGVRGRLQRKRGKHHALLIDDTYNANPESVRAALQVLAVASGKKILVLGDMGELGDSSIELHRKIGKEAKRIKVDSLLTLGELSRYASEVFGQGGQHCHDMDELLNVTEELLDADVTLLVKGSRFMQMDRVIDRLAASS